MEYIEERINLRSFIDKLQYFINRKSIALTPKYIKSMLKIDISIIESLIEVNPIKIVTEKKSYFSHIGSSSILNIYPIESLYVLLYINTICSDSHDNTSRIIQPFSSILKKEITIYIFDKEADETLKHSYMLSLLTSISIFGDGLKMDIARIDTLYDIDKNKIAGTKISPAGTFLGKQKTKYFKPKHNLNQGTCLSIETLNTKRKNYLKAADDELIVVQCPTCGNKHRRLFSNIKSLFTFSGNIVTLSCNHANTTYLYESKPYTFEINKELTKKHKKIELIMFIINNKEYYGLSLNKKTT